MIKKQKISTPKKKQQKKIKSPEKKVSIYVGLSEVAEILGTSKQVVCNWRHRRVDFPPVLSQLRIGPIWLRSTIEEWSRANGYDVPKSKPEETSPKGMKIIFDPIDETITLSGIKYSDFKKILNAASLYTSHMPKIEPVKDDYADNPVHLENIEAMEYAIKQRTVIALVEAHLAEALSPGHYNLEKLIDGIMQSHALRLRDVEMEVERLENQSPALRIL